MCPNIETPKIINFTSGSNGTLLFLGVPILKHIMVSQYPYGMHFCLSLPYFFDYKTEFFSFLNNPKDLDPSCKMDLDLWDCLGRVKLVLQQNFIGLIYFLKSFYRDKTPVL